MVCRRRDPGEAGDRGGALGRHPASCPKTWEKTWFNWLENIQPWCVSRQLWWGHQIPAWYDEPGKVYVAETEAEAQAQAGEGVALRRDPDVLDTWFSSALWPFATLGWPEQTEELRRHYPNDVLISGFDIIFFWDARMAMQGFQFMGEKPWKTLYLHGLVRDAKGQKMSKSKGNTVDPLGLIDRYGADALRFTLAAMESQGRDIKLDEKRVEGYRNFATKLWNAARFCQANGIGASQAIEPPAATLPVNRWIVGETVKTVQALDLALAELRFDESANTIYHFVWATFCDWYLELIKPATVGEDGARSTPNARGRRLGARPDPGHAPPVHALRHRGIVERDGRAALSADRGEMADAGRARARSRGGAGDRLADPAGRRDPRRPRRAERAARRQARRCTSAMPATRRRRGSSATPPALRRLARIEIDQRRRRAQGGAAQIVVDEATFILPLEGVIDIDAEKARLAKAAEAAEKERDSLAGRLANPSFVERAKPEAVEKARADHDEKASDAEKYRAALARLG